MHWAEAIAKDIVEKRKEEKHVVATGITPSGHIHVGNMREIITADAVHSALVDMGVESRLIYIADTYDPLRERYHFLPPEYESHVGKPLSLIPDPAGRSSSFADHFLHPFLNALDELGIKIELFRADVLYKTEKYAQAINEAIIKKNEIATIIEQISGRKLPRDWIPFNPICDACGRITSTKVTEYEMEKQLVYYECGCGNKGKASLKGGGKLTWRVDWAARWKILGVTVEPFGKDHAASGGSYDTGKRISHQIYHYNAPYPIPFEHILLKLDKGEKEGERKEKRTAKMSSSKGINIPIEEMLEVVSPEILKYIILRVKPEKHIELNPGLPLLNLIDEYERQTRAQAQKEDISPIPFRHVINVVQIARGDFFEMIRVIKRSGYAINEENDARKEIKRKAWYAQNWLHKFAPPFLKFELQSKLPVEVVKGLSVGQRNALKLIAREIKENEAKGVPLSPEDLHNKVYEVAETTGVEVKQIFKAIYMVLLKKPSGPRAGWFLASLEKKFLCQRLEEAAAGGGGVET
jgi:lysyl-tRNA synthetase class 1